MSIPVGPDGGPFDGIQGPVEDVDDCAAFAKRLHAPKVPAIGRLPLRLGRHAPLHVVYAAPRRSDEQFLKQRKR